MADVNEYLDLLNDGSTENKQRLKSSLYSSADSSPDAESALVKISKRSGIPVEALRLDNGAEAKRRVAAKHADTLLNESPVAAEFLARPENAQVSHDDIEALTGIEKIFTGIFNAPRMTEGIYQLFHSGKAKTAGKALLEGLSASPDLASEALARTGQFGAEFVDWSLRAFPDETGIRKKVSNIAKESADFWKRSAEAKQTKHASGSLESYLQQAGSSIGTSTLAAPFGLGGQNVALAMFGLLTEGGYQGMRDAGFDPLTAGTLATSNRMMEALTEKIGLGRLTKGSGPLLKKAAQFLVGDLGGEEVNTLYNALVDKVTVSPDMTMADLMQQVVDTAIVTSIAGPVQGATYHGVAKASETLYDKYIQHQRVQQNVNFLTALGEGAKASKTFNRLPEKVQELVASLKERAGGSVDNVFIPAERWSMLWQDAGVEPGAMAEEVIGDRKQYQDALAANSDIVIPLEDFIKLAGHERYGEIMQDVRLAPGDMTAREFEEWNSQRDEEIQRIVSEMQGDEQSSDRQVYDDVMGQLLAVGTERGAAEKQATLWQATIRTMATRAGLDPMELYRQYAPKIVRPLPEVLAKRMTVDMQIDPLLDRLRAGDTGPQDADIFGPSLIDFIRSKGGLQDAGGELAAMDAKKLIKNGGMELDRAREAAAEAGYLEQDSTVRDLLDALDAELRGKPRYAPGNQNNTLLEEREALAQFRDFLDQSNIDLAEMDNEKVREVLGQGRLFQEGVATDQTKTEAFRKWFGDSKAKGVFYHWTNNKFESFTKTGDIGFHFGTKYAAQDRASKIGNADVNVEHVAPSKVDIDSDSAVNGDIGGTLAKDLYAILLQKLDSPRNDLYSEIEKMSDEEIREFINEYKNRPNSERLASRIDAAKKGDVYNVVVNGDIVSICKTQREANAKASKLKREMASPIAVYLSIQNPLRLPDLGVWSAQEIAKNAGFSSKEIKKVADSGDQWKQYNRVREILKQKGYDGIVYTNEVEDIGSDSYIAFSPTQIKSAIGNNGQFDPANPNILFQDDSDTKRGFFDLSNNTIGLLENADLSTFLHESAHFYFQVLQDLASRPDAPQQIKDDYQLLLDWFGTDKPQTEHLEMFARGFEQYLGEGKAPTPELQSAFQRFKAWIVQVYRNLKNLNVPLSDEVRGVFDRLLATDEEIAQARDNAGVKPLFATAEDAGMTEAEFAAYQKDALAAGVREEERLTAQLMKEYQREQEEWWKNRREGMRLLVEQEAKQNPVYEVLHLLTTGQTFDGSEAEPIKLSKDELVRRYGKEFLKRLPRGFHHIYTVDGGTSIDMVAEMYGFESGDDLIKQMIEAPKMKDWIEAETDVRMRQEYGDKMTDGTITEDALAAVHSDGRARILRAELAAIRKRQREAKPYVDAAKAGEKEELARQQREREYEMRWMEAEKRLAVAIERGAMQAEIDELRAEMKAAKAMLTAMRRDMFAGIPPVDAFKEAARLAIAQKKIFDLDPNSYLRAEQKAANKAFRAAAKNDFATAGEAKQQQILNHFLYREARKAKEDAERIYKHVKKIQTTAGQELIAKGGSQFLKQINSLLEMFQFQRASKRDVAERESMREWARQMEEQGLIIPIDDKILDAVENVNYRQATVEELRAFYDALRTIEAAARHYREFRIKNEALEWENVKGDLIAAILDTKMKSTSELSRPNNKSLGVKAKGAALWRKFDAAHLKVEQIVEWLDSGRIDGPWAKYFFDLADHAQTTEYDYHARITKQLQELNDSMPKEWHGTMLDKLDLALPAIHPDDRTRYTLISIALNAGNDGNLQRLLDGNHWNETVLDEALQKLSADDWRYIQGVWDIVDSLWPDIAELQERVAGIPPKKVEAREFTNEHGTFRGGYFPLMYDPKTSQAGEKQAAATDNVTDFMAAKYAKATTGKGHTKERMDTVNARPLLDYERVLSSHMAKVVKDLSHREAVFYINRILKSKEIKGLLIDRLGEDYYRQMNAWLQTLISDRADSIHQDLGFFPNLFRGIRTNTAIVTMGWKISTMMAQFAGFGPSVDLVGYVNMTKGLGQFLKSPRKTWEMVAEKSGEMRHRANTIDRDIKDELLKLRGAKGKVAAVKRTAFYLTAMADRMVSVPTWVAGYNKALKEGYSEEDATRAGDRAVRLSQGSGGAKDLAAVQRQDEFLKLITMYYTPFSVLYARQRDVGHTTKAPKDLPRAIARSIALVIFPAVMGELLAGRGPDDDEDAIWWAARKILLYPFAAVPVVRDLANNLDWSLSGSGFSPGYKISPLEDAVRKVMRAIGNLDDAWDGSKDWDDVAWDAFEASGYIFGLPTAQTRITGEYLEDLLTDGENTDKLSGVLFRRVKGR